MTRFRTNLIEQRVCIQVQSVAYCYWEVYFVIICRECNISVDPNWTICPTCSSTLTDDGKPSRRMVSRDERYASNLSWYYHLIPVATGILSLVAGDYLVKESNPLLRTVFPPFCLIVGGWIGLILLGIIASYQSGKNN